MCVYKIIYIYRIGRVLHSVRVQLPSDASQRGRYARTPQERLLTSSLSTLQTLGWGGGQDRSNRSCEELRRRESGDLYEKMLQRCDLHFIFSASRKRAHTNERVWVPSGPSCSRSFYFVILLWYSMAAMRSPLITSIFLWLCDSRRKDPLRLCLNLGERVSYV